jgi:hypothetical protein
MTDMTDSLNPMPALWQSFYSTPLYRRVQHWRGLALFYLAMVLVLCWTPLFIKAQVALNHLVDRVESGVVPQIPTIHFAYGQITTPENRPYIFRFGEGLKKMVVILDTSGHYSSLDAQEAQILFTRDKCFVRQKTGDVRTYDLSKSRAKPMVIDQAFLHKVLTFFRRWSCIAIYPVVLVLSFLKRLMQAFFMALFGLALVSSFDVKLDVGELLSLGIVSMTPAMILQTLATGTGVHVPLSWLLWGLLIAGYFIFAINAASDKTLETEVPSP